MSPFMSTSFERAKIGLPTSKNPLDPTDIQTIPELVDFNAKNNPDYLFCKQARKLDDGSLDLLGISHRQLRDSVLHCQAWMEAEIQELALPLQDENGHVGRGPPIALLMESDIGLIIHLIALMGLGVPVLLLSNRLNSDAIHQLLVTTGARAVLASPRLSRTCQEALGLQSSTDVLAKAYDRKEYGFFLDKSPIDSSETNSICRPYYHVDEMDRQVIILHSSGTTGLPKPIYQSHEYLLGFAAAHNLSSHEAENLNVSTLPLFHGFGMLALGLALGVGLTLCLPVSSISPGASVVELLKFTNARSLMTVPSILEDISLLPEESGTEALLALQFVAFGGGLLKPSVGEKFDKAGVKLVNHFGATEVGAISPIWVPQRPDYDYRYFRLRDDYKFEVLPADSEGAKKRFTLVTYPFGWGEAFEIKDELGCNPLNKTTDFSVFGRTDDVIALATGEKVLPNTMEALVTENQICKTAVAVGQGQFEIGLLVEPSGDILPEEEEQFKDDMWKIVQAANEKVDTHARVSSRDAIIMVSQDEQIPRSDKGSVLRQDVYKVFDNEISEMYKNLENMTSNKVENPLDPDNFEPRIKNIIQERLNWKIPPGDWDNESDLFDLGMDSLQALQLRRFIIASMPKQVDDLAQAPLSTRIPREFVYWNPSVAKMAKSLRGETADDNSNQIDNFVSQYSTQLSAPNTATTTGHVILLTGSTGSLGAHLLEYLVNTPTVSRIICLNRVDPTKVDGELNAQQGLKRAVKAKGLALDESAWEKVETIQTNLQETFLGLGEPKFDELCHTVTHVLHNGWPMNFNISLSSFEGQFKILRSLIELVAQAYVYRPSICPNLLFVSSIAVVGKYPSVYGESIVPEMEMQDDSCTDAFGYAEAKLVCERIITCAVSALRGKIQAKIVRVGQMTGSSKSGIWNATEHFPALVKSSSLVGALPKLQGTLSWLPVDYAAKSMSELLFASGPSGPLPLSSTPQIFHLENPIRQSWADVLEHVALELSIPRSAIIPYRDWLAMVLAVPDEKISSNPAKKMAEFFENDFEHMAGGQIVMGTEDARKFSPCLRGSDAVSEDIIRGYVRGWREVGFLD